MAKKKTSTRVAKLAGRYAAMTDEDMANYFTREEWAEEFCDHVRLLAASALSQTEPTTPKKAKVRK